MNDSSFQVCRPFFLFSKFAARVHAPVVLAAYGADVAVRSGAAQEASFPLPPHDARWPT